MIYIREIAKILNVDINVAEEVFDNMMIDVSECTDKSSKKKLSLSISTS